MKKNLNQINLEKKRKIHFGYLYEKSEKEVEIESLEEKLTAIKEKYYNVYENQEITSEDGEFDKSTLYVEIADCDKENLKSIYINSKKYDNENKKISIGQNSFIVAPIFLVEDGKLLVSPLYILNVAETEEVRIVFDDKLVKIKLAEKDLIKEKLEVEKVEAILTKPQRENKVFYFKEKNKEIINQISENGEQAIGIVLKDKEGNAINDVDETIYLVDENDNASITVCEEIEEEKYTITMYLKYQTSDYEVNESQTTKKKIIVIGKGYIDLYFKLSKRRPDDYEAVSYVRKSIMQPKKKNVENTQYKNIVENKENNGNNEELKEEETGENSTIEDEEKKKEEIEKLKQETEEMEKLKEEVKSILKSKKKS